MRDMVLVRVQKRDGRKTEGGLHIPDTSMGREDRAEVIATGPGRVTVKGSLVEPCVKKGDVVLFDPYGVTWHEGMQWGTGTPYAKGGELALVNEQTIHAVIEGE
jgi:chaperonin GroES